MRLLLLVNKGNSQSVAKYQDNIMSASEEDDEKMKELLNQWGGDDDDDDDSSEEDDDEEIEEREVTLNDNVVDHVVLAAATLEAGMSEFEQMTGCSAALTEAAPAFVIKGLGIRCARIGFGDSYLEIIAPDAERPGPIGTLIKEKGIAKLTLFHYAIRTSNLDGLVDEVPDYGYTPDHITMFGNAATSKDGEPRRWELLYLYGHSIGGMAPYFVKWSRSDHHPCCRLADNGSEWEKLVVRAPSDDPIHLLMEGLDQVQGLEVEVGDTAHMSFHFSCPEGSVSFETDAAVGFKFPGFDEENGVEDDDEDALASNPALAEPVAV